MIEKFTVADADLFTFYKIPKELFTNPKYESVSTEGKVLESVKSFVEIVFGHLESARRIPPSTD